MKLRLIQGHSVEVVYGDHFEEGRSYSIWRPHGSGDCLLLFTLGGRGQVGNRTHLHAVKTGDVAFFEKGLEQVYLTDPEVGQWEFLWCHYLPRQGWNHSTSWPRFSGGVRVVSLQDQAHQRGVKKALEDMIQWARQPGPNARDFALNALEKALLWVGRENDSGGRGGLDSRIVKVMEDIARQVDKPFDLAVASREAGLSVSRMAHLFREQTGTTPRDYAEEQKMRHAAQLLRLTSLTVKEVAAACGFENAFYFSTRFSRWSKLNPRDFRKKVVRGLGDYPQRPIQSSGRAGSTR